MKLIRIMVAAVFALGFGNAYAFHSGGVAECDGCHTMHNSKGGAQMTINSLAIGTTNAYLLQGVDQSSTCLVCHASTGPVGATAPLRAPGSYHILDTLVPAGITDGVVPLNYTPGGDFGWLKKDFSWLDRDGVTVITEEGFKHGHNIVAGDFGIGVDPRFPTAAPGGDAVAYPADKFACSSCHDPHGRYRVMDDATGVIALTGKPIKASGSYVGNTNSPFAATTATEAVGVYRILAGANYQPKSTAFAFAADALVPIAVAPNSYNRKETATDTLVRYGANMSEFCKNCHPKMHGDTAASGTMLRHPASNASKMTNVASIYNQYVSSGTLDTAATANYSNLVPFEMGTTDRAALAALTPATMAASNTTNVMCLSCHRAHASGFESMMRWQMENEFITKNANYQGSDLDGAKNATNLGRTTLDNVGAYYDRPATKFATYQRVLCNKCHGKD